MNNIVTLENWRLALLPHSRVAKTGFSPKTVAEITASACDVMDAAVPGNLELDLIRAGKLPEDIFFGTNILEVQKYERTHLWYFTTFTLEATEAEPVLYWHNV